MEQGQAAPIVDRKARMEALRKQVEEAEAAAQVGAEEAEERTLVDRLEAAKLAGRRAVMMRMVDHYRKIAEVDGSFIVAHHDMEDHTPGAGLYVLRSPTPAARRNFQAALAEAGNDPEKADRAYNNISSECILWSDAPAGDEEWAKHCRKYAFLTTNLGDAAGRLGGAADRSRKR